MVKHLRNEHKYTYERIREEWKNVVEERNVVVVKDGIDIILENVKRL
jgi:accessory gene regulator protein AgrB